MGSKDNNDRIELKKIIEICNEFNISIDSILEVGSMTGDDSKYLSELLNVEADCVYILEPHPAHFKRIMKKYPQFNVFNLAAWKENGETIFHAGKDFDDGRSSILEREYEKDSFLKVKVKVVKIGNFIQENISKQNICCKIDVEGAAYEVLSGFEDELEKIKLLQIETEQKEIWKNQKIHKDVEALLLEKGFEKLWETKLGVTQVDSIWRKNENKFN